MDTDDIVLTPSLIDMEDCGTFYLFSDIDSTTSEAIHQWLDKCNICFDPSTTPLTVKINSGGGAIHDGYSIAEAMINSPFHITTHATGYLMSSAVDVFMAGDDRLMDSSCIAMVHQYSLDVSGKHHEHMSTRAYQDFLTTTSTNYYKARTKMTNKMIENTFNASSDIYLTAKECLKYGICHTVL